MTTEPRQQGPRHVAIIMDGNGRWAHSRGLPRQDGHEAGAESVREIVRAAGELGIDVLTLYSFSTENWARPEAEVDALMRLLGRFLVDERDEMMRNRVRLGAIGDLERLDPVVKSLLDVAIAATESNDGLRLFLALSYGARSEIVHAAKAVAAEVVAGRLTVDEIDQGHLERHLSMAGLPHPDLLIRTSGEMRLSNFLLWQVAYAEIVVTDVPWPDFRREHLVAALDEYGRRQRRFGRTGAQLSSC